MIDIDRLFARLCERIADDGGVLHKSSLEDVIMVGMTPSKPAAAPVDVGIYKAVIDKQQELIRELQAKVREHNYLNGYLGRLPKSEGGR